MTKTTGDTQLDVIVGSWKPGYPWLQPRQWPIRRLHPARSRQRRIGGSCQHWFGRWSRKWVKWQIVIKDIPSTSTGGGTNQVQGRLSSGWTTSRCRKSQQRTSGYRQNKAASRQHQLLSTCMKLKIICINGKIKTTPHIKIMEQQ
jgi:hypothetical protein